MSAIQGGLLTLVVIALVGGLMVAGYLHTLIPITLQIEGVVYKLRTHQVTVEGVLRDAGVFIYPEDLVRPPLVERIEANDLIRVERARPVRVHVDGKIITGRSLKHSIPDILADLGVELSPYDKVVVSDTASEKNVTLPASAPTSMHSIGNSVSHFTAKLLFLPGDPNALSKPTLEVVVHRAVSLELTLNGQKHTLHTAAPSVGEALLEAGIVLYEADRVQPELSAPVQAGMSVSVKNATPLTILVDGRRLRTRTHAANVADALVEANLVLTGLDYTQPSLDSALMAGLEIRVIRVRETFAIEQEPVPFEVFWRPDPELEIDSRELRQGGENGVLQKRIRVRYEDGQEVSRKLEDQGIVRPPQNKIIAYGTNVVVRTLDTSHGPIEYWRRVRMLATSYSASTAGTPASASYYGRTALGWAMRHGVVAVDPRVVRLGSNVYVPGYGIGAAGDTGGAIVGRRIDLGYDDDNLVLWYRWVDVYLLTPVPPDINYVIPDWPPEP